jgi:hypothetical protein
MTWAIYRSQDIVRFYSDNSLKVLRKIMNTFRDDDNSMYPECQGTSSLSCAVMQHAQSLLCRSTWKYATLPTVWSRSPGLTGTDWVFACHETALTLNIQTLALYKPFWLRHHKTRGDLCNVYISLYTAPQSCNINVIEK